MYITDYVLRTFESKTGRLDFGDWKVLGDLKG